MRNLCNNKKVSKLPHLSKFVDDLSQQSCKKHMSDRYIVLKSPDLSCETYLSTSQMVARTVTSQNNLKNLLHLTGSAEMKKVSKFPTLQENLRSPSLIPKKYIDNRIMVATNRHA